ncbi:NAD(P)/FAD-dependent oxidoreductase [Niveispirillum irakense]|uniref:NAD(P)/FAD-dependent oxidoreductase n=1 Tax=Niveispirillum irakense TaxID=34011 RepID=UPI0003FE7454|nr:FAD-dependent oxidoreductase [Niveispirillum irakense]
MARILLVGAGHAHLHVLAQAGTLTGAGHDVGLISPGPFHACCHAAPLLSGEEGHEQGVPLSQLVAGGKAHLFDDAVIGIDAAARLVHRHDGAPLSYDILSLSVGSIPRPLPGTENHPRCFQPKPFSRLLALRDELTERFIRHPGRPVALVIAGGGVTAVELAMAILTLAGRQGGQVVITILCRGRLLTELPERAGIRIIEKLAAAGTILQEQAAVTGVEENEAVLATGDRIAFDLFINATGLIPPPLARVSGLPVTPDGAIRVDERLQVEGVATMLASGDCSNAPGPALRHGRTLARNLMALAAGQSLRALPPAKPSHRLALGHEGLVRSGQRWWLGRSALWLKHWHDRRLPG